MESVERPNFIIDGNAIRLRAEDGSVLAEVTYPACGDGVVEIDHTFVDATLRGQGMAGKLLDACAHELERTGRRARPTCSYAVSWFEKHPEWAHLLA
ncbi:GNAT family N-acetyltransferase [uncultured Enorma sp.]|uniref:GNAT family N-acetyltransferase n=1 Tax=uncultured Enorma sp. TaxID=1714346 RepID=UPI002803BCA7|nr:GNAT family N-acetyltransferase [uncultured Enorma sp.]